MKKIIITESQLKRIIEDKKVKKGSPEELVDLLKFLPIHETSQYISEEVYLDLVNYYENDITPNSRIITFHPEEECLKPYEVEINFKPSGSGTGIGYADDSYIDVKYVRKDSLEYRNNPRMSNTIKKDIYHMVKHECSHFYLAQRGVESCLYHTHPDGMKKYYQDRQEMVLHSREIFERFTEDFPKWRTYDLETIAKRLEHRVKHLQSHTSIYYPFNAGTQKKYLSFIMNHYVKPELATSINEDFKDVEKEDNTEYFDWELELWDFGSRSGTFTITMFEGDAEEYNYETAKIFEIDFKYSTAPYEAPSRDYPGYGGGVEEWYVTGIRLVQPEKKELEVPFADLFTENPKISEAMNDAIADAYNSYDPW
jgi:hypothetical protein